MTLPASVAHIEYVSSGTATYIFPFRIDTVNELEVRVDGVLNTDTVQFTTTGVGTADGGEITFFVPPINGAVVSLRRVVAFEQLLDLIPNSALPAAALEDRMDEIVKMVQQLEEEDSRRPQLAIGTKSAHRYLIFPTPGANKAIGWNALGTALTTLDVGITLITVDAVSGKAFGKTVVTVSANPGNAIATISNLYPSGVMVEGVTMSITTTFGNSNGLTTLSLGDSTSISRWGSAIARTAPTKTNPGYWEGVQMFNTQSAGDGYLVSETGAFDSAGVARIVSHWSTYAPD